MNDIPEHSRSHEIPVSSFTADQQATVVSSAFPYLEITNHEQILRFSLEGESCRFGRDRSWSDLEVPDTGWEVLSRRQAILVREGESYRIYDGDREEVSRNGIFLNHSRIDTQQGLLLKHGTQLEIGQNPRNQIILKYFNPLESSSGTPLQQRLDLRRLREFPVELGREPDRSRYASSMQLDSPVVSRRHATIFINPNGRFTLQDHSTNGTFINDRRVERFAPLEEGDRIRIGPFTLVYERGCLELADRGNQIRIDAAHLVRQVKNKQGRLHTILDDVSLSIEPGQLVALVGGSGAGKSTLMKTLLGIEPTTSGTVFLNGDDLRRNFDLYRTQIGYVPQDDIVHADLTVEEVLTYACKLRLPPDTNISTIVDRTLEQIKLKHVRHTFIRDLSGGQRKRVSIGVELLADPKLFFLDEPTSGLDPGLDKEMMKLLRELADQGRTIILVTHATANLEVCNRIAFLGRGGRLCYFGPPREALDFFEMPAADFKYFADIYLKLDRGHDKYDVQANVHQWGDKFQNSTAYQTYIEPTISQHSGTKQLPPPSRPYRSRKHKVGSSPWQQTLLLSQRYWQLVIRDRVSLLLALLTGPIGIMLTRLATQGKNPLSQLDPAEAMQASLALRTVFVFSCIAIWVGISCSAQEIVKEAAVYSRERLINLGLIPYLSSKLLVRSGIAIGQTLLFAIAIFIGFNSPEAKLLPWTIGLIITNFLMLLSSICLGLLLSSIVKNENQANNALPLIMIPQIIFSGVLFDLDTWVKKVSWFMLSRWSVGAYGTLADVNAMIPAPIAIPSQASIPQPIATNAIYDPTWHNLGLSWGVLCLSGIGYLCITFYRQKRKDLL
jgi:ABC-type multidrug transport system ATPase subunit/pSer/pThr/pTyr-binding forkhead associated (FHA) protein/ABC-type multidrug transport system permease subunit